MNGQSAGISAEGAPAQPELTLWSVLLTSLVIAVAVVVLLFATLYAGDLLALERPPGGLSEGEIIAIFLAQNGAILGAIYLVLIRIRGFSWRRLGLTPAPRKWLLAGLALGVLVFFLSIPVEAALEQVFDISYRDLYGKLFAPFGFTWTFAVAMTVLGVLVAPFCEELFFRGVIYNWMRRVWNVPAGIVASAALFAAVHMIPAFMLEIFLLGLLLAWLYEKSASLLPSILLHMTLNFISFVHLYAYLARTGGP